MFSIQLYKKDDNYSIRTLFDGEDLLLEACNNKIKCPIANWMDWMKKRLFLTMAEIKSECAVIPTADEYLNDAHSDFKWDRSIMD